MRKKGITDDEFDDYMKEIENRMIYEDMLENFDESCDVTKRQIRGKITRCDNAMKSIEARYEKVGSSKEYTCPKCNMQHCRDVSAARNILIRYLVKYEIRITAQLTTNLFTHSGPSDLAHTSLRATHPALFAKN